MYLVEGSFPDYSSFNKKGTFNLNCDKAMAPGHWSTPIKWSGYINNTAVSFIQIKSSGKFLNCYDWTGFPENYDSAKSYIVEAIDKKMKVMD